MKNEMDPQKQAVLQQMSSAAVLDSLPKLEELPETYRRELIQALAALLLHQPALQALLEVRHEPEQ
jgi:hypothetical protein